ncbi:MAG: helix-turn-helix domain-containing protein [candidate division KSB1 bacterium]|nr:helix-turn-helix domain-containing protein [candidate division KSB1 bacterium]
MLRNPGFRKRYEEEKELIFLGYQIRQERRKRKISQKNLAKLTGLTARQISQIETAEEAFDLATLLHVASALGLALMLVPRNRVAHLSRSLRTEAVAVA